MGAKVTDLTTTSLGVNSLGVVPLKLLTKGTALVSVKLGCPVMSVGAAWLPKASRPLHDLYVW